MDASFYVNLFCLENSAGENDEVAYLSRSIGGVDHIHNSRPVTSIVCRDGGSRVVERPSNGW